MVSTDSTSLRAGVDRDVPLHPQTTLRPPSQVMRLSRMGSFFPTRLSFLRSLLRKLAEDGAQLKRPEFSLDGDGYGHAVYEIVLDGAPYCLIAYSSALDDEMRTDRVIAEAWDACFILFDGRPNGEDVAALRTHATQQEAGRYDPRVLVVSRANKSVRLFEHTVERLAFGDQPDAAMIGKIGYLMRTTAVYGNGKFGMADRVEFMNRNSLSQPFRLEMLTVYLIREFTIDLVQHVANARAKGNAAPLAKEFQRQLGIGNSTGLGMAPFLVSHPVLINNWMQVRETALARVRAVVEANPEQIREFKELLEQVRRHLGQWHVDDVDEQVRIDVLRDEFDQFCEIVPAQLAAPNPWDRLVDESELFGLDLQELVVALVLEPNGALVDGLCDCMEDSTQIHLDPTQSVGDLRDMVETHYDWVLALDLGEADARAMVWYVSEEKLEPRLGARGADSCETREMPHHIAHKVQALRADLDMFEEDQVLAVFLMAHPEHRDIARRIQTISRHPYGEVRDNLVAKGVRPIDLLRCKLSFFGAAKFDPRSDRWTRITLFQGAPRAAELTLENSADVFLPAFGLDPFA